jgi:outer membrane protein assembly factor BamB
MGFFASLWMIWVYTALFVLLCFVCLIGLIVSTRQRAKWAWGVGCVIALVALAAAFLTGFTFHLNASAPVARVDVVYLTPGCLGPPDSCTQTDLTAVRVSDGQILWRHPIREGFGGSDTFISDAQHLYLDQYALDATHLHEDVITALDAHSGRQVWQVVVAMNSAWVGVFSGRLVLSTSRHTTLILDGATGKTLAQLAVGYALFEQDGIVYSCSLLNNRTYILATDEATGHQLWRSPNVFGCVSPVMARGVLITSGNGILTAIRMLDGEVVWQVHDGAGSLSATIMGTAVYTTVPGPPGGPEFPGGPYYPGNDNVVVHARSLSEGKLLWQVSMGNYPLVEAAADNSVLVENGTGIGVLRGSDGRRVWSLAHADASPHVATVVDGVVLLAYTTSTQIVALDLQRGSFYWQISL